MAAGLVDWAGPQERIMAPLWSTTTRIIPDERAHMRKQHSLKVRRTRTTSQFEPGYGEYCSICPVLDWTHYCRWEDGVRKTPLSPPFGWRHTSVGPSRGLHRKTYAAFCLSCILTGDMGIYADGPGGVMVLSLLDER